MGMATVPLSGTNIRLLSGVPFSNDYKNTRWFDTKTEQTTYFQSKPTIHLRDDHTFQRKDGKRYVSVNRSIDELWGTNYLMFQNTAYNSKWFYGFVTNLEYVNKSTTYVHFEIDVFQTWKFEMNFKPSYVVREHCKLWNDDGSPVINTIDEGLSYGADYETVSVTQYTPNDDLLYLVVIAKETLDGVKRIEPTINGTPQPLSFYIVPFKKDGTVPTLRIGGTPADLTDVKTVLKAIFSYTEAVNNIVGLYITEYFGRTLAYDGTTLDLDSFTFSGVQLSDNESGNVNFVHVKDITEYQVASKDLGNKYSGFTMPTESKLLMYPYCVTFLDDFKGNRVQIKNENIKSANLSLRAKGSLGTSNKVAYAVANYLKQDDLPYESEQMASLEYSLINNSPNDISILNDFLTAYLQGNKNQIENQKSAIMFNGTVGALTGGMVGTAQSIFHTNAGWRGNPVGVAAAGMQVATGVGNAVIELQGLQAKQQDIDNTPAQMVKMGGNSAFDYGNKYNGVYVVKKQIREEYQEILSNFFKMFGYKVNKVKVPNFHTRQNWNYVQTLNCNITGNFNNDDLNDLKKVFDGGITFWHTDDVGNYELENGVI